MESFGYILAVVWGGIWAAILQWTQIGRFLALRRTWLTVVIGVGVTLLIALPILGLVEWFKLLALFGLASLGIILRSVWNGMARDGGLAWPRRPGSPIKRCGRWRTLRRLRETPGQRGEFATTKPDG